MSWLTILIIVLIVLLVLGFFGRVCRLGAEAAVLRVGRAIPDSIEA
jgi:hypothetical protein